MLSSRVCVCYLLLYIDLRYDQVYVWYTTVPFLSWRVGYYFVASLCFLNNHYLLRFPVSAHNYVKDFLLVTSLVIAIGGCWLAYMQSRYSQCQVKKLMMDMKHLQQAETALGTLKQK